MIGLLVWFLSASCGDGHCCFAIVIRAWKIPPSFLSVRGCTPGYISLNCRSTFVKPTPDSPLLIDGRVAVSPQEFSTRHITLSSSVDMAMDMKAPFPLSATCLNAFSTKVRNNRGLSSALHFPKWLWRSQV